MKQSVLCYKYFSLKSSIISLNREAINELRVRSLFDLEIQTVIQEIDGKHWRG